MSWNARLVFLIAATTLISYVAGLVIAKTENAKVKKFWFVLTLIVCLGALIFFKYFNFLLKSAVAFLNLFSMNLEGISLLILLPVGISFYTFQTLSYVIDVYRGTTKPEKHLGYYALFVSYFPQLVAGPIERPENLLPQLRQKHSLDREDFAAGLRIMLCGFFRKCVIADFCGIYVNQVFNQLDTANSLAIVCAGALFAVQMYCDFAGYSEIAVGAARMMGVRLMKNFDKPFLSLSFTEFFRRWHISLNQWFTDYLYKPLGGNRKGKARKILNTFIVFALCGLWHGANWTYVLWGLYCAVVLSLENILKEPVGRIVRKCGFGMNETMSKLLKRVFLFLLYIPASVIFRSPSVGAIGVAFYRIVTQIGFGAAYFESALSALNLSVLNLLFLALSLFVLVQMSDFGDHQGAMDTALTKAAGGCLYVQKVSVYLYSVMAIAVCWLILLSAQDISAFVYFQF